MRRATAATYRATNRADERRSAAKGQRRRARKGAAAAASTVYSCLMSSAIGHRGQIVQPRARGMAVGRIKRAVTSGLEAAFSEGLALERELQQQLFLSTDAREGISAHVEKREPKFQGS